jgi:putative hydrolase of the HAD superfamily
LFDMTGTLHPQSHTLVAAMASIQVMLDRNEHITLADCAPVFRRSLLEAFESHAAAGFYLQRDLLAAGHRAAWAQLGVELDDASLAAALDAFETTLVNVIEPFPSAIAVLDTIRRNGIATAIVSVNDERLLQDCVDACGLRPYVDLVLSSEAARSCKPHPGMFDRAMVALGVAGTDTVFVGDMPELDIAPANRVGMHTVLTIEDGRSTGSLGVSGISGDVADDGTPDATIDSLADLPALLGLA